MRNVPDKAQVCHLSEQFEALRRQASLLERRTAATYSCSILRVPEREPDRAQTTLPPPGQVAYVNDRVSTFHKHYQTRLAIFSPQAQVMIQVFNRFEKPRASLLFPTLIESNLGKRLCFGFLGCAVDSRSGFEVLTDVLCQETRGHGRKRHGYPS